MVAQKIVCVGVVAVKTQPRRGPSRSCARRTHGRDAPRRSRSVAIGSPSLHLLTGPCRRAGRAFVVEDVRIRVPRSPWPPDQHCRADRKSGWPISPSSDHSAARPDRPPQEDVGAQPCAVRGRRVGAGRGLLPRDASWRAALGVDLLAGRQRLPRHGRVHERRGQVEDDVDRRLGGSLVRRSRPRGRGLAALDGLAAVESATGDDLVGIEGAPRSRHMRGWITPQPMTPTLMRPPRPCDTASSERRASSSSDPPLSVLLH